MRRLGLIVLLMLCIPAPAHATLAGDGERYAAWDAHGVVHVLDDDGPTRTFPVPDGCTFRNVGGGRLLFDCPTAASFAPPVVHGMTIDLASGTLAALPDWDSASLTPASEVNAGYVEIGTRWAVIGASGYHWSAAAYVPLAGGNVRVRGVPDVGPARPTHMTADLNAADLDVAMCPPLRVPGFTFAVDAPSTVYRRPYLALARSDGRLLLWHCGHRAAAQVTRCTGACSSVTLGAGALAWVDARGRVHVLPHHGRSQIWRPRSIPTEIALTGRRVVVRTRSGTIVTRSLTIGSGG